MIEVIEGKQAIGIARYRPLGLPDEDLPVPEIGFAIAEQGARGRGTRRETWSRAYDSTPTERRHGGDERGERSIAARSGGSGGSIGRACYTRRCIVVGAGVMPSYSVTSRGVHGW